MIFFVKKNQDIYINISFYPHPTKISPKKSFPFLIFNNSNNPARVDPPKHVFPSDLPYISTCMLVAFYFSFISKNSCSIFSLLPYFNFYLHELIWRLRYKAAKSFF